MTQLNGKDQTKQANKAQPELPTKHPNQFFIEENKFEFFKDAKLGQLSSRSITLSISKD